MRRTLRFRQFFVSNKKEIRFIILFFAYFVLGQGILSFSRPYTETFLYTLNANVSSKIINTITPDERTFTRGRKIVGTNSFTLDILQSCDGMEGVILIIAAMLAFYMGSWNCWRI